MVAFTSTTTTILVPLQLVGIYLGGRTVSSAVVQLSCTRTQHNLSRARTAGSSSIQALALRLQATCNTRRST
ncbi:unnamed protein product [Amoebophrya sp. A120]|nr:unnamed protein product [Amoebophrya sp. A120]|eukprot:GSA120T00013532001.1